MTGFKFRTKRSRFALVAGVPFLATQTGWLGSYPFQAFSFFALIMAVILCFVMVGPRIFEWIERGE